MRGCVRNAISNIDAQTCSPLRLELEENAIRIRAVNRDMTQGASLVLLRLIVERGNPRRCRIYRQRMTLKAQ